MRIKTTFPSAVLAVCTLATLACGRGASDHNGEAVAGTTGAPAATIDRHRFDGMYEIVSCSVDPPQVAYPPNWNSTNLPEAVVTLCDTFDPGRPSANPVKVTDFDERRIGRPYETLLMFTADYLNIPTHSHAPQYALGYPRDSFTPITDPCTGQMAAFPFDPNSYNSPDCTHEDQSYVYRHQIRDIDPTSSMPFYYRWGNDFTVSKDSASGDLTYVMKIRMGRFDSLTNPTPTYAADYLIGGTLVLRYKGPLP